MAGASLSYAYAALAYSAAARSAADGPAITETTVGGALAMTSACGDKASATSFAEADSDSSFTIGLLDIGTASFGTALVSTSRSSFSSAA